MPSTVLIIPAFNDRPSCARLLREISSLSGAHDWRICLVDDGSTTDALQLSDLSDLCLRGTILRLARNIGHQAAIACGIGYAAETWPGVSALIMDADGEDRPDDIPRLLSSLDRSHFSAVVAERRQRTEKAQFRVFYWMFKRLFRLLSGHSLQFGNFMALSGSAVRRLASMQETWLHVAAALIASRIPRRNLPTDRGQRYFGNSTMNFISLAVHGMRALMVFAEVMLMRVVIACAAISVTTLVLVGVAAGLKVSGQASPGWFTSVFGIFVILITQTTGIFAAALVLAGVARGLFQNASTAHRDLIAAVEATP